MHSCHLPSESTIHDQEIAGKEIQMQVFHNFDDLAAIRDEWDNLVQSTGGEIYLSFDWCRIWWKYYRGRRVPSIFVFRHEGTLVGIIPLFFDRIWLGPVYLRAARLIGADYTPVTMSIPVHKHCLHGVIEKCLQELTERHDCDIVHFGPLAGLYEGFSDLYDLCRQYLCGSLAVVVKQSGVQTYFQLKGEWEDYISSLGRKERRNIRAYYRKLTRGMEGQSMQIESSFVGANDLDEEFDAFVHMHQSHWNKLGKLGHFGDWPRSSEFHRDVAKTQLKRGRLRFLKSRIGHDCLGYEFYYRFGNKYFGVLNSHSDFTKTRTDLRDVSLGKIMFSELAKEILKEGVEWVDSMRGRYEYKLRLGGKLYPIRNIYVYPKKKYISARVGLFRTLAWLLNTCYYRIWFLKIAPKLPFQRRPLWRIWIRTCGFSW